MTKLKLFGFFDDKTDAKFELSKLMQDVPHPMEQKILHYGETRNQIPRRF